MNTIEMAQTAYRKSAPQMRTPRGNEYDAFARITRKMIEATTKKDTPFATLVSALHDNRRLWTLLASDIAEDQNGLPDSLRAQLFYLAEFTSVHTSKVLAGDKDIRPLVDINLAIMRGLKSMGEAA